MTVYEVVECEVQLVPGVSKRAPLGQVRWQDWIEQTETRRENSAVRLGEQDGDAAAEWRELVTV